MKAPLLVRRTFTIAKPILLKSKWLILSLLVLSILLGVVPTLKSDLEAGIIDQANSIILHNSQVRSTNILDIFHIRLQRFSQTTDNTSDIVETLSSTMLRDITFGNAFVVYAIVLLLAFGINFLSTKVQAKITA